MSYVFVSFIQTSVLCLSVPVKQNTDTTHRLPLWLAHALATCLALLAAHVLHVWLSSLYMLYMSGSPRCTRSTRLAPRCLLSDALYMSGSLWLAHALYMSGSLPFDLQVGGGKIPFLFSMHGVKRISGFVYITQLKDATTYMYMYVLKVQSSSWTKSPGTRPQLCVTMVCNYTMYQCSRAKIIT